MEDRELIQVHCCGCNCHENSTTIETQTDWQDVESILGQFEGSTNSIDNLQSLEQENLTTLLPSIAEGGKVQGVDQTPSVFYLTLPSGERAGQIQINLPQGSQPGENVFFDPKALEVLFATDKDGNKISDLKASINFARTRTKSSTSQQKPVPKSKRRVNLNKPPPAKQDPKHVITSVKKLVRALKEDDNPGCVCDLCKLHPVQCPFCHSSWPTQSRLHFHIGKIHEEYADEYYGPIDCERCGYTDRDRKQVAFHRLKAHGIALPSFCTRFECEDCGHITPTSSMHDKHVLTHKASKKPTILGKNSGVKKTKPAASSSKSKADDHERESFIDVEDELESAVASTSSNQGDKSELYDEADEEEPEQPSSPVRRSGRKRKASTMLSSREFVFGQASSTPSGHVTKVESVSDRQKSTFEALLEELESETDWTNVVPPSDVDALSPSKRRGAKPKTFAVLPCLDDQFSDKDIVYACKPEGICCVCEKCTRRGCSCPLCHNSWNTPKGRFGHIGKEHPEYEAELIGPPVCEECGYKDRDRRQVAFHRLRNHQLQLPKLVRINAYQCDDCGMYFPSRSMFGRHISKHGKYLPEEAAADQELDSDEGAEASLETMVDNESEPAPLSKKSNCTIQKYAPKTIALTLEDGRNEAERLEEEVRQLLKQEGNDFVLLDEAPADLTELNDDSQNWECEICIGNVTGSTKSSLIVHMREFHETELDDNMITSIEASGKRLNKEVILPKETPEGDDGLIVECDCANCTVNAFACPLCHSSWTTSNSRQHHVGSKHRGKCDAYIGAQVCDMCPFADKDRRQVAFHRMRVHGSPLPPLIVRYVCEICGFVCQNPHIYKNHLRTHGDERPFQCDICHNVYATYSSWHKHKQVGHSDDRPYTCSVCGKGSKTRSHLKIHMYNHIKERPFACTHCDYQCTQRFKLNLHLQRKHNIIEKTNHTRRPVNVYRGGTIYKYNPVREIKEQPIEEFQADEVGDSEQQYTYICTLGEDGQTLTTADGQIIEGVTVVNADGLVPDSNGIVQINIPVDAEGRMIDGVMEATVVDETEQSCANLIVNEHINE